MVPRERLDPERLKQHRRRLGSVQATRHSQRHTQQLRLRPRRLPERRQRLRRATRARHIIPLDAVTEFVQRPARPSLGARRERPLPRPHHDRCPPIPPIHRVAVVAHVALVLGLVGLQVRARSGGTDLMVRDVQRDRLTTIVLVSPPAQGDLVVDQRPQFVVLGDLFVVVGDLVVVGTVIRVGVPGLPHLRQRQHRLAPGLLRRGAHQRGPLCVDTLEPTPAQAALRVLVVKQEHKSIR